MKILDACCGSKMFWYNKHEPHTTYLDNRQLTAHYQDRNLVRTVKIAPDIQGDFRDLPFDDNTFDLVVFDPPHLLHAGKNSWLRLKYGVLPENWQPYLKSGFNECLRVLKPTGVLLFKWNSDQIKFSKVMKVFNQQPIFGDRRSKTRWSVFIKPEEN